MKSALSHENKIPTVPQASAFVIAALLILSLASFTPASADPAGAIVIAQKGDVVSLNPLLTSDYASSAVYHRIFNGLLKYDENMKIVSALASDYRITLNQFIVFDTAEVADADFARFESDCRAAVAANPLPDYIGAEEFKRLEIAVSRREKNTALIRLNVFCMPLCKLFESKAGLPIAKTEYKPEFELALRKGVQWHDDTPFGADDVVFTYDTVSQVKKIPAYDSYNISAIESVEKTADGGGVRITFKYPTPRAFEALQMPILPRHKLEGQDIFNARFNMMPVGTGPFRFVERAFEDYIILARNDKYFGGAPDVEKITFRIIPNESIMFLELLQGNIDIMQLKPDQFVKFTDTPEFEKRFVKIKYPEREYTYIGWNLKNRIFADEAVRVAISRAIDKNALIEKTLYNLGQISDGPFYPSSWASNPAVKNTPYDLEAAKKALADAGWVEGADGVLEKKFDVRSFFGYDDTVEVQKFEFDLLINAGNKDRELCAKFVASELRKIGIRVSIDTLEWKDFIKLIDSTEFDAFILTWSLGYDPDISSIWHSSNIPDMKRGKFGLNSVSYRNPEVDRLLDEARQTIEQNQRTKSYHRIHEIIMKEQPYCFLYIADTLYAVARRIKNARPSQAGIFNNIEKWKIEK